MPKKELTNKDCQTQYQAAMNHLRKIMLSDSVTVEDAEAAKSEMKRLRKDFIGWNIDELTNRTDGFVEFIQNMTHLLRTMTTAKTVKVIKDFKAVVDKAKALLEATTPAPE